MKLIILITVLLISFNAYNKENTPKCVKMKPNKIKCGNSIATYDSSYLYKHGKYKVLFNNKKNKTTGSYSFGRKSGVWKHFYPNGQVQSLNFFYKGFRYDRRELFSRKGKLLKRMIYPSLDKIKKEQKWDSQFDIENLEKFVLDHLAKKIDKISKVNIVEMVKLKSKNEISIIITKNKKKYFTNLYVRKLKQGWKIW